MKGKLALSLFTEGRCHVKKAYEVAFLIATTALLTVALLGCSDQAPPFPDTARFPFPGLPGRKERPPPPVNSSAPGTPTQAIGVPWGRGNTAVFRVLKPQQYAGYSQLGAHTLVAQRLD